MAKLPDFRTPEQAIEFWETHNAADYLDETQEVQIAVNLQRNLLHPRLTILTHRPQQCPRCKSDLEESSIEYVTRNEGHLIVIRDVPILRCRANKHEYLLEATLDAIERLLTLDKTHQAKAIEEVKVPVFSLSQ
jgi:YgiT-type zinc finger domain-containing protein